MRYSFHFYILYDTKANYVGMKSNLNNIKFHYGDMNMNEMSIHFDESFRIHE